MPQLMLLPHWPTGLLDTWITDDGAWQVGTDTTGAQFVFRPCRRRHPVLLLRLTDADMWEDDADLLRLLHRAATAAGVTVPAGRARSGRYLA